MTTKISDDHAMDAVVANRPTNIDHAWHADRSDRVLQQVLAAPRTARPVADGRPSRRLRPRHVAAAVALVAAVGLFAQVLAPLGTQGSPQAAQALDRLAAVVPASPMIPEGAYELTVYEDTGIAETDDGPITYSSSRSTWRAADGWAWARQEGQQGNDPTYYIFSPVPSNYSLDAVPAVPWVMEAYLRTLVMGSTSVEEALFVAVSDTLMFTPTPADTRAAAIRMLAGVSGVTVTENTTDPAGRPATEIAFVDEKHRPGIVNAMYLDPATAHLTAKLETENGETLYSSIYTERRIVPNMPPEIIDVLGTERVAKTVQ